jgi:hypothetical protein
VSDPGERIDGGRSEPLVWLRDVIALRSITGPGFQREAGTVPSDFQRLACSTRKRIL